MRIGDFVRTRGLALLGATWCGCSSLFAGFGSTETFLPAVGRVPGQGGAQFYTTVWATNLTSAPQTFTFRLLKQGQANGSPASFSDSLEPGETKVYENVVESKLGLANALGAGRVTSTGEIFVSERIYNQAPGNDVGNTEGLFFAGVPKSFSISSGQSASIQGVDQGGSENFRYNFALIETGGGSPTVNIQVFDGSGTMLGQRAYALLPYEQIQPNVGDVVAGIHTTNARITATVTGGGGSVLLAGAQLANESQDSSGFEMTFRDSLLGTSGGTAGVTSLNGLTGALTLKSGSGISITPSGSSISIAYTGGGASGITSVTHDASLAGAGTGASPLSIANGQVVRSLNGLHDDVTLQAGANVTLTPNGSGFVISSAAGGLTLPYAGTNSSGTSFSIDNNGGGVAIVGESNVSGSDAAGQHPFAIYGFNTSNGTGVYGSTHGSSGKQGVAGVWGDAGDVTGIYGSSQTDAGVRGVSASGYGVYGETGSTVFSGVTGYCSNTAPGIYAESAGGSGIYATGVPGGYFHGKGGDLGLHVDNADSSQVVAEFDGPILINGGLHTNGVGYVTFDDPRDPSSRSITHAFVGSSEMKNIYDGVATLDAFGVAVVDLPEWFEALNRDFRYQLTALGTPQAGIFVSNEISENRFKIAGGVPGARVSWQVTGVRKDSWARSHPIEVMEFKSDPPKNSRFGTDGQTMKERR